uniref:Transposase-associated domain-containing protein n=1 Tax=Chenopodium quinoa TaxID=63459 RepID=A0A803N719_CHEQI
MDHNWMNYPRSSEDFKVALNFFLDDSFAKDAIGDQIFLPCKTCSRRFCHSRDDVYDHLIVNGFVKGFKEWVLQREGYSFTNNDRQNVHEVNNQSTHDDIDGLLHDTFRDVGEGLNRDHEVKSEPNEEARKFFHLVEEGKKELYPVQGIEIPSTEMLPIKVDIDEFGLTYVPFKKKCSKDDPFVLASQVHQVYYSQDPLEEDIQYVMKRVPRDLFDFEEALSEETYWEEPIDSSSNNMPSFDANHIHVRDDVEVRAVNIDDLSEFEDINDLEDGVDYDDTDWNWMDATDDFPAHDP